VAGAGLSLKAYDNLYGTTYGHLFGEWVEYARRHYMHFNRQGEVEWFALFVDPIERTIMRLYDETSAYASLCVTPYVYPQDRQFGALLYETSVRQLGWNDPAKPLIEFHPDPRFALIALLLAREVGDRTTEDRIRARAEAAYEPRRFGENDDFFGWFFNNGEDWPRGQLAALAMTAEIGERGAWTRLFEQPNLDKFSEPTVRGVDFPHLGIAQAWNDRAAGALCVETYAATSSLRGSPTTWQVTNLPDANAVKVTCDGADFTAWRVADAATITVDSDIDDHAFRILTGYHGDAGSGSGSEFGSRSSGRSAQSAQSAQSATTGRSGPAAKTLYVPSQASGRSCCG